MRSPEFDDTRFAERVQRIANERDDRLLALYEQASVLAARVEVMAQEGEWDATAQGVSPDADAAYHATWMAMIAASDAMDAAVVALQAARQRLSAVSNAKVK